MLIYKNPLPIDTMDIMKGKLPFNTAKEAAEHVLTVDKQHECPCMWYQADLNNDVSKEFNIIAIGTGHDWAKSLTKDLYIGTLMFYNDSLVLHYFIVEPDYVEKIINGEEED